MNSWSIIIASGVIFGVCVLAMAVGVIFSDRRITGSCGGLSALFGKGSCELCENKDKCDRKKEDD